MLCHCHGRSATNRLISRQRNISFPALNLILSKSQAINIGMTVVVLCCRYSYSYTHIFILKAFFPYFDITCIGINPVSNIHIAELVLFSFQD